MIAAVKSGIRLALHRAGYDIRLSQTPWRYRLVKQRHWGVDYIDDLKAMRAMSGRPLETVFVIGAFEGHGSKEILRAFPEATVHSFEPDPSTYARLVQNLSAFHKAVNHPLAIGRTTGKIPFHVHPSKDCSSLLAPDKNLRPAAEIVQIDVATLDDFCEQKSIGRVDYMHCDVQGYEYQLLQGAERMLHERRIGTMLLEVCFDPLYKGQSTMSQLYDYATSFGYRFVCMQGLFFDRLPYPRAGNMIFTEP